ncbi:hypothetical protein [Levilactobacillus brevis]|uniref:hypothetical protein n=2 Tax=Levilactobacillus brevis TaxID=1580 RepID=UPI000B3FC555|nr:hypothetical protein [Levilactobacillus brevis]TYA98716.1 hypothetical protein FXE12_05240 [Lactobacillus sp. SL9-6]AWP46703.1 hypothetical protein CCS05_07130 [Levilactobacillus brevis]MCF7523707.1 hypothetical protein [Levilactobacillus brevis]MCT3566867.1 hypothetical protein [Levilactobacillus brevis]RAY10026.1 hypothetical protein DN391_03195 [Levilactobacillus brevis]
MKKILTTLISLIALTVFTGVSANASYYKRAHVTRNITVYRFIKGSSFATSHLGSSLKLHYGKTIHITPFYHMGKDGYMLKVNGHGSKIYYARTNSSKWFK